MNNDETTKDQQQCLLSAMQNFSDHKHAVSCQLEGDAREKMREIEEHVFKAFSLLNDAMIDIIIPLKLFMEYFSMVKKVVDEMERDLDAVNEETEQVIELL
jgi:hypothetical protein